MNKSRGFTLIELLVTIAILTVLATLAIPSYRDFIEKSHLRGAAEAVYEQLQYARALSLKKSVPIIVDFSSDGSTTWALGITDKNKDGGCDASDASADPCTIDYDNDSSTSDPLLLRLAYTDFKNITMTAPSFGTSTAGPGACATKQDNEACFEPIQGLARPSTGHIQVKSDNYTLQVEVDAAGKVKVCVPSGEKPVLGYEDC